MGGEDDDGAGQGAVGKGGGGGLGNVAQAFKVLEDVVGAESDGGGGGLFERGGDVASIQRPQQAMVGNQGAGGVPGRGEPLGVSGVVYQSGLDAFGRGDGEGAGNDTAGNAGQEIAARRQGSCLRVAEGNLDAVEGDESDGVLGDGAYDQGLTPLVQGPGAFGLDHIANHLERVTGGGILVQLDSGLGEFKSCKKTKQELSEAGLEELGWRCGRLGHGAITYDM